ncbi:transposase [Enterobacter cloacae]
MPKRKNRTIDNNQCENSISVIMLGRKNWPFSCLDADGERAAILYSCGTCGLNVVEPEAWLRYILEHIQD